MLLFVLLLGLVLVLLLVLLPVLLRLLVLTALLQALTYYSLSDARGASVALYFALMILLVVYVCLNLFTSVMCSSYANVMRR